MTLIMNLPEYGSSASSHKKAPTSRQVLARLMRMVCPEGFEPPTFWFVAKHSIQLSYGHIS